MTPPTAAEVADRALVLYAYARRATIEYALGEFGHDPQRVAQAETARTETDRWLERESLVDALTHHERQLFAAGSGVWPNQDVTDGMWRREALAVLLWAVGRIEHLPPFGEEADPSDLDEAITGAGSVSSFRAGARLRPSRGDRARVGRGRRVVRRDRGQGRGRRHARLDQRRTAAGPQLAPRSRRRTSVTTPQIASPISASGSR